MRLDELIGFLNENCVRYINLLYSPAYSPQDIQNLDEKLGRDLVEAVLLRIDGERTVMAVVSASRKLSIESLQTALGTNKIQVLGREEVRDLFPDGEPGVIPPLGRLLGMDTIFANDLNEDHDVTFHAGSVANEFRLRCLDLKRLAVPLPGVTFATTPRYKVEVSSIAPNAADLPSFSNCFFGISLQNPSFARAKLVPATDWIGRQFRDCKVLVGDSIHRISLQIKSRTMTETRAWNQALRLGREFIDHEQDVFARSGGTCSYDFVLCSEVQEWPEYPPCHEQLLALFLDNPPFAESVTAFAKFFVARRLELHPEDAARCIEMSCTYLLEELAIFACLVRRGYPVMVYPGSLAVLTEIAEGRHPEVPEDLKKLVSVSLRLKSR